MVRSASVLFLMLTSVKTEDDRTYASWMNELRIEEAKRTMREHPDWNNEAVAQHCGFSDRTYFQRKFKEATGQTPAEYLHAITA